MATKPISPAASDAVADGRKVTVVSYDQAWPDQFRQIQSELAELLDEGGVSYDGIEHIGSTSVPGLAAKANIDIVIVVKSEAEVAKAIEAFDWQFKAPRYTIWPNGGGIMGRESFKLPLSVLPHRSVYVINENDHRGQVNLRNYRDVRETLIKDDELMNEYGNIKLKLSAEVVQNPLVEYGRKKNDIVARILKKAGWTDEEIAETFSFDTRTVSPPSPPY